MTKAETDNISERPPVGNLTDFAIGVSGTNPLDIEVAVDNKGKIVVFYDKPFREDIAWFEYDVTTSRLDFIMGEEGKVRDVGLPLSDRIARHMHNTHQILAVLMDDRTGEPQKGDYVPLIVHQS